MTSKGQVTIPQHIRERLGLLPYSEVEFEIDGDSARVLLDVVTEDREWLEWSSSMLSREAERGPAAHCLGRGTSCAAGRTS